MPFRSVINYDSDEYIKSPDEWKPLPGSLEAIAQLNKLGYKVTVATNQSGVNRGLYSLDILSSIHEKMRRCLTEVGGVVDTIFFCPHTPTEACNCRKPKPGLLQQIAAYYQLDLTQVPMVGDTMRDLQAAKIMHCQPILVRSGNFATTIDLKHEMLKDIPIYDNLAAYVNALCKSP